MLVKIALVMVLALSLQDGCETRRPGSDKGGDGNPTTGECEISYSETLNGKFINTPS